MGDGFAYEIFTAAKADVYLDVPSGEDVPWPMVRQLDEAGIRAIGHPRDVAPDAGLLARLLADCTGVISRQPDTLRLAEALGIRVHDPATDAVGVDTDGGVRSYAFLIGRLERDFALAREAIRATVEDKAGVPLLWVDDARHRTNVASVRERTRLLIKHAVFVVADLTLGVEGPDRENPSRAHEIGMALAYDRPVMLSSQEPRRHPYFSVSDMQMDFWDTEDDLRRHVADWIYAHRESVSRRVFNHDLVLADQKPRITPAAFEFDVSRRYRGPNHKESRALRVLPE